MSTDLVKTPEEVLSFWFEELSREQWFAPGEGLDETIRGRFAATHLALARGEAETWRSSPDERLAAIVVLDQFSRNIYRGTPLAFAADWLALREAKLAVEAGADLGVTPEKRCFFYLPFEHSEDPGDQDRSVDLFKALGDAEYLDYAERHRAVISEFGRFPHRNRFLGRESTSAELDYLSKPGAGF
ncbi:DUF924 family protein [Rhizobium sp. LCM 4573]|uniref:DUF924 family protein n=1 Tax=Rhizobium sp. LCM 4573 TaxID=1848291 RepID=UPI0008DB2CF3|nr:DUF924 family protein [Rhizobium sp. LCM 4573]OHV76616.1 hypothetical protein LCM4573_13520 [Rhizobium sp. LCM 4573]